MNETCQNQFSNYEHCQRDLNMANDGFGTNIHDLVHDGNFERIKVTTSSLILWHEIHMGYVFFFFFNQNWIYFDINLIDAINDTDGKTPLIICAHKKSHFEIAKFLLDCGCK